MYRSAWWSSLVLVSVLVVSAGCRLHPPPAPPRHTNLGIEISRLELSNGLPVIVVRDPRAAEVQVTMRYRVGSVDDPDGQEGMAHLVEHLMFQQVLGTQSVFAHLESHASYFNAFTSLDATTFIARAQASRLDELLSIEAVRVGSRCTSISDSAFVREREVVVNEARQRDAAETLLADMNRGLYPEGHPYRRRTAGSPEGVAAITREQACAFADAHYAPGNAVLVVSGDVTQDQIAAALKKFLARVPQRTAATPRPVPRIDLEPRQVETPAHLDQDALLVAWPLPADPALRTSIEAVAQATLASVDSQIAGSAQLVQLGGERAPLLGIAVLPADDEKMADVLASVERGVEIAPLGFEATNGPLRDVLFDRLRQGAIYGVYATLEEGGDRDTQLAAYVSAGRDPSQALAQAFAVLRDLSPGRAAEIVREQLSFARATVVIMHAQTAAKHAQHIDLAANIHDLGQQRDAADPAEAHHPQSRPLEARGFAALRTRELPNGLKVVLLPVTSVPTVEVRLVFGAGTADDPAGKRGSAQLAAHGLEWDMRYLNDLLLFAAAGGSNNVAVDADRTALWSQGLDMHLDLLLAGMRRWVREGHYDFVPQELRRALRKAERESHDTGALTDAWHLAQFGAGHPYATAVGESPISDSLTVADVEAFRESHFTPDNATLVITGGFDPALADRWIDFLFRDWSGHAAPRSQAQARSQPASLARAEDTTQAKLAISIPTTSRDRASRLVAAAMLDEITGDVRHRLGATYGLAAQLDERRLSALVLVNGSVEVARLREAVEMIQHRLTELRQDPEAAARSFVAARQRVQTQLVSLTGRATVLAQRIDRDVTLGRPPLSDLQTAIAVQALTIEAMAPALATLDLANATVLMQGPEPVVREAFEALGRTPTFIDAAMTARVTGPEPDEGQWERYRHDLRSSDLSDAITTQGPSTDYQLEVDAGLSKGSVRSHSATGWKVSALAAYRIDSTTSLGIHAALGRDSGAYDPDVVNPIHHELTSTAVDVEAALIANAYDRLWGGFLAGLHADSVTDNKVSKWYPGFGVGLEGGVDVVKIQGNRLDVFGRLQTELFPSERYVEFTLGLAYRR